MKIFYDTETCGLSGIVVLIQYATDDTVDNGEIKLFHVWLETVRDNMKLIEWFMENELVGFNLAFDHFHLTKWYTILEAYVKDHPERLDHTPNIYIKEIAAFEKIAMDGNCVKPKSACDLMLVARKGKYQITMERSDIKVKRIPTVLAWDVAKELEKRIIFEDILFARQKNKTAPRWAVRDIVKGNGIIDTDFKDIVLKFKASSGLKALAVSACNFLPEDVVSFNDVAVPKAFLPDEVEYAPFADAVHHEYNRKTKRRSGRRKFYPWPTMVEHHIRHWQHDREAQKYAINDVVFTRSLYVALGSPECGDVDSVLACCVAAVRWRGYAVNIEGIKELLKEADSKIKKVPLSQRKVADYLNAVLSPEEQAVLGIVKTGKLILEDMATSELWRGHPVAQRARDILEARNLTEEKKLYKKLIIAGRLHFGVKVIGTLSSRMAGDSKLNPQGIKRAKYVRKNFTFAHGLMIFLGGDFDSFEVGIADAVYQDEKLHSELKSGEKIHTLFAMALFPDATKEQILASKGSDLDMYDMGKRGVFAMIYGGNWTTLVKRLGVSEEIAQKAEQRFLRKYPGIARARQKIIDAFSSMRQPGGLGTKIVWNDPLDYVESLLGHRRYFTLENKVCKALFDLANKPLDKWKKVEGKVVRRERQQTIGGAIMSALYACAFNIQSSMTRQAGNHEIQSTGAQITKDVQKELWNIQPHGITAWRVQPCNIHDELLCPTHPDFEQEAVNTVNKTVDKHRKTVPLIGIKFGPLGTWADK